MANDDAFQQSLITTELQLNDTLSALVPGVWAMFADKSYIPNAPRLQYWYTLRKMLDLALGSTAQRVDWTKGGVSTKRGEWFTHLAEMRENANTEIALVESRAQMAIAPVAGNMTTTAPVMVDPGFLPDPNDPSYQGDPLLPPLSSWENS